MVFRLVALARSRSPDIAGQASRRVERAGASLSLPSLAYIPLPLLPGKRDLRGRPRHSVPVGKAFPKERSDPHETRSVEPHEGRSPEP